MDDQLSMLRQLGAHPTLSLSLPCAQDTRRSQETPSDLRPITPTPGEEEEPLPCREYPSGPGAVPSTAPPTKQHRHHCSPSASASLLPSGGRSAPAAWRGWWRARQRGERLSFSPGCAGVLGWASSGMVGRWPFLLWGCSLSAAWLLQADLKQGPPTVPSSSEGGLCHSPGEFGKERPLLKAAGLCSLVP